MNFELPTNELPPKNEVMPSVDKKQKKEKQNPEYSGKFSGQYVYGLIQDNYDNLKDDPNLEPTLEYLMEDIGRHFERLDDSDDMMENLTGDWGVSERKRRLIISELRYLSDEHKRDQEETNRRLEFDKDWLETQEEAKSHILKYLEQLREKIPDLPSHDELRKKMDGISFVFITNPILWIKMNVESPNSIDTSAFYDVEFSTVYFCTHNGPSGIRGGDMNTTIHELFHAVSQIDTWVDQKNKFAGIRRIGVQGERSDGTERLRWLDEAIIEQMAIDATNDKYNDEIAEDNTFSEFHQTDNSDDGRPYYKERLKLKELTKKIPFYFFIDATLTKQGLARLARKVKETLGVNLSDLHI